MSSLRNTASGIDNVSAHAVKLVTDIVSPVLARIVNTIFVTGVFPARMKIAKVLPLYKSKDKERIEIIVRFQ